MGGQPPWDMGVGRAEFAATAMVAGSDSHAGGSSAMPRSNERGGSRELLMQSRSIAELLEHCVRTIYSRSFRDGLNPAQWNALRFLSRANIDARTLSGFALFHQVKKSTASLTISSLVSKGLIRKEVASSDRRVVRLSLTPAGERVLDNDPLDGLAEAIGQLPADLLGPAAEIVGRIASNLFTAPAGPGRDDKIGGG